MSEALLDTNVLVYAAYKRAPLHVKAAGLVSRSLKQRGLFCVAHQNLVEFCAVTSRVRFVEEALPPQSIHTICQRLHQSRKLRKIYPKRGTILRAIRQGVSLAITGPRWYDLFLAATMRDAAITVVVTENTRDFERIPFVKPISIDEASMQIGGT